MSFDNLGLIPSLLKAVKEKGYEVPSPIQEKAIPLILKGKDILASAQTGTGKTAGFTLPLLQRLSSNPTNGKRNIRALILTPTRELAAQIYDNVLEYSTHLNLRSTVIFGGVNQRPQVATLRQGVDVLIATPGRLLDLVNQKVLFLSSVNILVLDEATSSVDSYSEEMIQIATDKITKDRTSIIIAHRLATIKKADKIIVMEAGKIVEIGTHYDLIQKEKGYYKNLYEVQFLKEQKV